MANGNVKTIYQSKKGITLTDGYYRAKNPRTKIVCIISISNGIVAIHEITKQMHLQDLVNYDAAGYLEIDDQLVPIEQFKKNKKK